MPVITFEKLLKIIEVIVNLIASALKAFNYSDSGEDD